MTSPPPLSGIRVLEFAGLAPGTLFPCLPHRFQTNEDIGPFAGLLLADYGASVLRIDRAIPNATHTSSASQLPTADLLSRRKTSIAVSIKDPRGIALLKDLIPHIDVIIDPFRPGVLEKAGLGPEDVLSINPRVVYARMTGFRRDGKYAMMAGHDINYIAVSGALSMLGRAGERPYPPGNILGDFAGGGHVCFTGILLALLSRGVTGRGQVVEANMVDGSAVLATMPRLGTKKPNWNRPRGTNMLDGGCAYYDTYETKDGKYMAVGALEPQFFAELIEGLGFEKGQLPMPREDPSNWPKMRKSFAERFRSKTRAEWERAFDGTDACCTPVLTQKELEDQGFDQRPIVTLRDSPGLALQKGVEKETDLAVRAAKGQGSGVESEGWDEKGLSPSVGGEETLAQWLGWRKGKQYEVVAGGLVKAKENARL